MTKDVSVDGWCVLPGRVILSDVEPTELTAAVVTAWATVWVLNALPVPTIMAVLVGVIVLATVVRTYRARWRVAGEPEAPPA